MFPILASNKRVHICSVWLVCVSLYVGLLSSVQAQTLNTSHWSRIHRKQYKVSIVASTKIWMLTRRKETGEPILSGRLFDDRSQGIARAHVLIHLPNGRKEDTQTDAKGFFEKSATSWPKKGKYTVEYVGSKKFARVSTSRLLDFRRVDLKMSVSFKSTLESGQDRFTIRVQLSYRGRSLRRLPVVLALRKKHIVWKKTVVAHRSTSSLLASAQHTSDSSWPLVTLYSDRTGRIEFIWKGKPLQGPATLHFMVVFAGNHFFQAQKQEFQVYVRAPAPFLSKRLKVWIGSVCVLVLLGFGGFRLWNFWEARRSHSTDALPRFDFHSPDILLIREQGSQETESYSFEGYFVDRHEGKSISSVCISIHSIEWNDPSAPQVNEWEDVYTSQDGRFSFQFPGAKRVELQATHPLFRTKTLQFHVPHHGSGHRMRVEMTSYKTLLFNIFTQTVRDVRYLSQQDPKKLTVRQLLEQLEPNHVDAASQLLLFFEEAYYGRSAPRLQDYATALLLLEKWSILVHKKESSVF